MTEAPILVVDDDPSIVSTVSEILDFEGYPVQTAANGAEALRAIERMQPSLVLLDMRMPVMDGWGFANALRERGVLAQVHYLPVYLHPWYRDTYGYMPGLCPAAEEYYAGCLSLPCYPSLTDEQQDTVVEAVRALS